MFISAHLHLCSSSHPHTTSHLSLLRPGAVPPERHQTQPSEIVRIECAKCRRECDLARTGATLCGDRVEGAKQARVRFGFGAGNPLRRSWCRGREVQARVHFVSVRRNPLRRSCVSRARNAGESAFCLCPAQPSAEIAHVEGDFLVQL